MLCWTSAEDWGTMSSAFLSTPEQEVYAAITAEDAVDAARYGRPLRGVEIADLRNLLEALERDLPQKPVHFVDCRVLAADVLGLRIARPIEFRSTVFARPASFACVLFEQPVEFVGCTFRQDAIFASTQFQAGVRFTGTAFGGNTSFQSAVFNRDADFEWTRFQEPVPFDFAQFVGSANFHEARFAEAVTFGLAHFHGAVRFLGAVLGGMANFQGAIFESCCRLNLSNVHLKPGSQILLTTQQLGACRRATLHRPPAQGRNRLQRTLFRLSLPAAALLQRRWPSISLIEGEDAEDPVRLLGAAEQYNMLRDNFRTLPGREQEEDRCHYRYKDLLRQGTSGHYVWRFLDWAVYKWCLGYGIYTRRVLCTGIMVIALFALLYWLAAGSDTIRGFDRHFNSLYFSAVTFTTIGYGDYAPRGWLRCVACVEGLLGLVLTAVFTVSFARKLIR